MQLTPAQITYVVETARRLEDAGRGELSGIVSRAAAALKVSPQTFRRYLARYAGYRPERKTRSDKGVTCISEDMAQTAAGLLLTSTRATGKQLLSFDTVREIMQHNGIGRANPETGEITMPSVSTLARAMRAHGCHPDQLRTGRPAQSMRSPHPNHTWLIDASVCVMYYLPDGKVQIVDEAKFYKNKPRALEKIARSRVIRYVVVDHCSGFVYLRYDQGDEDAKGVLDTLIAAMCPRGDRDPMRGAPYQLMTDKGAGNTSRMVSDFLSALDIRHILHSTGNPRAKGAVEVANNIVERAFEGRLRFLEVRSLEDLQRQADAWRMHFNARAIHTRTGKTRNAVWQSIRPECLRLVERATLEEIAAWKSCTRKIDPRFTINVSTRRWGAQTYDLRELSYHGLAVHDVVDVRLNPYKAPAVTVSKQLPDGTLREWLVEPVRKDDMGFIADAAVIGEEHKALPKTRTEKVLEDIERKAYAAPGMAEVEQARASGVRPFARLDIMADVRQAPLALFAQGVEHAPAGRGNVAERMLDRLEAAQLISSRIPQVWARNPRRCAELLRGRFPEFMPESQLEAMADYIATALQPARVVNFEADALCAAKRGAA
jgi:transposase InsO family protein